MIFVALYRRSPALALAALIAAGVVVSIALHHAEQRRRPGGTS